MPFAMGTPLSSCTLEIPAADSLATEGEAQVLATWEIIRPLDDAVLARGSTDYRQPGWEADDYAALVKRLDAALQGIAKDVMACIARLPAMPVSAGLLEMREPIACARAS